MGFFFSTIVIVIVLLEIRAGNVKLEWFEIKSSALVKSGKIARTRVSGRDCANLFTEQFQLQLTGYRINVYLLGLKKLMLAL